jgi:hypothetical protein
MVDTLVLANSSLSALPSLRAYRRLPSFGGAFFAAFFRNDAFFADFLWAAASFTGFVLGVGLPAAVDFFFLAPFGLAQRSRKL